MLWYNTNKLVIKNHLVSEEEFHKISFVHTSITFTKKYRFVRKTMKQNVTTQDIKDIGIHYGILLSDEQLNNIQSEYNRTVMDRANDWEDIVKELFVKEIMKWDRLNFS